MRPPPLDNPSPPLGQRLDRLLGDLNVLLAAFAIGLACLDLVVFATVTLSQEILHQRHDGRVVALFDGPSASAEPTAPTRGAP